MICRFCGKHNPEADSTDTTSHGLIYSSAIIMEVVANHFRITMQELTGQDRRPQYTLPRHLSWFLIRDYAGESLNNIGKRFQGRHHTTIKHGLDNIESTESQHKEILETLREKIKQAHQ